MALSEIERKKKEVELRKVEVGVMDFELVILEREDEIRRIKANIEISNKRIEELKELLSKEGK